MFLRRFIQSLRPFSIRRYETTFLPFLIFPSGKSFSDWGSGRYFSSKALPPWILGRGSRCGVFFTARRFCWSGGVDKLDRMIVYVGCGACLLPRNGLAVGWHPAAVEVGVILAVASCVVAVTSAKKARGTPAYASTANVVARASRPERYLWAILERGESWSLWSVVCRSASMPCGRCISCTRALSSATVLDH